jgi:hypothetical protein
MTPGSSRNKFLSGCAAKAKAAAEGIDEHLATVGGGLVRVGQLEVQFIFRLVNNGMTQ